MNGQMNGREVIGGMKSVLGKIGLCATLLCCGGALNADGTLPELPRGKGENCVQPTELMRKNHMDYLIHQRDLTVHSGIRTPRHSLVGCVQCHVQQDQRGQFIAIDAPGQFCQSCHAFTSVRVDCFECHATKPDGAPHENKNHTAQNFPAREARQ